MLSFSVGVPKAGVFAEGAAKIAAASIIAVFNGQENKSAYTGVGSCYIEFGEHQVTRVDVAFFSGPKPFGTHYKASKAMAEEKEAFGASRRARWFGLKFHYRNFSSYINTLINHRFNHSKWLHI
jgi:sulfide:quinone oxidoreductase